MGNPLESLLERWGLFIAHNRSRVLLALALLGLATLPGVYFSIGQLDANIFNQVSPNLKRFRIMRELSEDFGGDILAAVIKTPKEASQDPDKVKVKQLREFGNILVSELSKVGTNPKDQADPNVANVRTPLKGAWLQQVECKAGEATRTALKHLAEKYPHAVLTENDVAEMKRKFEPQALKQRMKELRDAFESIDPALQAEFQRLQTDPLEFAQLARKALQKKIKKRAPDASSADPEGYFLSPDKTMLLILARPIISAQDMAFNRALLLACQRAENRAIQIFRKRADNKQLTTALKGEQYGIMLNEKDATQELQIGFTGMHAVSMENEQSLRMDVLKTTGLSALIVLALFYLVFHKIRLAFHISLTMGLAIVTTLTINALTRGTLGVMGAGFPCILLGMGVDYGIHLFTTFHTLRADARVPADRALALTLKRCGTGILAASATTMVAFFGLAATDFRGLAELGFLSGLGLFLSAIFMLSLFPALILGHREQDEQPVAAPIRKTTVILGRLHRKRHRSLGGLLTGLAVCFGLLGFILFGKDPGPDRLLGVRFDSEFTNLRSLNVKALTLRDEVGERFNKSFSDIRVVVSGADEAQAFQGLEAIRTRLQPQVDLAELTPKGSVLDLVPSPHAQTATLKALKELNLKNCELRFMEAATQEFGEPAHQAFKPFRDELRRFEARIAASNILTLSDVMKESLGPLLTSFVKLNKTTTGSVESTREDHVRLATYYFPAKADFPETWFWDTVKTIEEPQLPGLRIETTAPRLVGFELRKTLFEDMRLITGIVGVCVISMLFFAFRSVKKLLLAALPLVFGYLFLLGGVKMAHVMGWSFSLNYVNLMIFPVLLGSGIDYGVYLVYDVFSDRNPGIEAVVTETGKGILLCGLTTLAGFGSMIFGSYTGLIDFGWAALLGYTGALFGALVVLPSVLSLMQKTRT